MGCGPRGSDTTLGAPMPPCTPQTPFWRHSGVTVHMQVVGSIYPRKADEAWAPCSNTTPQYKHNACWYTPRTMSQYLTDFTRSRKTQAPNTCYRFAPSCPLQRVILHPPQSSQCWIRGGGHTHATWTTRGGQQDIGANMSTKLPQGTHIMNRLRHNATRSCMWSPNWKPHTE